MNSIDATMIMTGLIHRLIKQGIDLKQSDAIISEVVAIGDLIDQGFELSDLMYTDYELGQKDCLVGKPAKGGMSSAYERGYQNQNQLQVRAS